MTGRTPRVVSHFLCRLACVHLADLTDDDWDVWLRLRKRYWLRCDDSAMCISESVWRAFYSRPDYAKLMRASANAKVRDLAVRLDVEAAAAAFDEVLRSAHHGQ